MDTEKGDIQTMAGKDSDLQLICTKHPRYRAIRAPRSGCGVCKEIYDLLHTFSSMQIRNALLGALIRQKHDDAIIDRRFN